MGLIEHASHVVIPGQARNDANRETFLLKGLQGSPGE
jgi:hypothetical protein